MTLRRVLLLAAILTLTGQTPGRDKGSRAVSSNLRETEGALPPIEHPPAGAFPAHESPPAPRHNEPETRRRGSGKSGGATPGSDRGTPHGAFPTDASGPAPRFYRITGYTPDDCTDYQDAKGWCDGMTTSGQPIEVYETAACPRSIPLGTRFVVEGAGVWTCHDRGCDCFDLLVATEEEARDLTGIREVVLLVAE